MAVMVISSGRSLRSVVSVVVGSGQ